MGLQDLCYNSVCPILFQRQQQGPPPRCLFNWCLCTMTCSPIQSIQQLLEVRFFFNILGIFLQMSSCGKNTESQFCHFIFSLYLRCLFIFYIWLFHYFTNCDYLVFNGHMSGFQIFGITNKKFLEYSSSRSPFG